MPTYPCCKGGEYGKNRIYKTCGFVKSFGILQNLFVDIKQKRIKTAEVVCFGAQILTSKIHSLRLNEEGSIKRHEIFPGKRTAGYCKSKNHYRSFFLSIFYVGELVCVEN